MSELDLLTLARSATQNEVGWFTQIITINFAMIVAIYYFLHRADLPTRIFGFVAYMIGMLIFWGEMLIEANLKYAALLALKALAAPSPVTRNYLVVNGNWLGLTTAAVFNVAFWVLWGGVFYLVFFWRKSEHPAPG
jgi:hypothetical protein